MREEGRKISDFNIKLHDAKKKMGKDLYQNVNCAFCFLKNIFS